MGENNFKRNVSLLLISWQLLIAHESGNRENILLEVLAPDNQLLENSSVLII